MEIKLKPTTRYVVILEVGLFYPAYNRLKRVTFFYSNDSVRNST
ncbi:hypothetical protein GCM10008934_39970 [Virgibacillus salarius]